VYLNPYLLEQTNRADPAVDSIGVRGGVSAPFWNSAAGGYFVLDHMMDGSTGDAVSLGDLAKALPSLMVSDDGFAIEIVYRSSFIVPHPMSGEGFSRIVLC
jgi:hypothetical protein